MLHQPVVSRFSLPTATKRWLAEQTPRFGFGALGETVFVRTYARGQETWADVVQRVVEGTMAVRREHFRRNQLHWDKRHYGQLADEMAKSMFEMEWLPPGRGLWMMGTDYAYQRGAMALNNCAATDTADDLVLSAEWTMDALMNGVGVGFSTHWRGTAHMPDPLHTKVHVIGDSREGWVESVKALLLAYLPSQRYNPDGKPVALPVFDYSKLRPAGSVIRGFGGTASGPEPLRQLHQQLTQFLDAFCAGQCNHTRLVADIFNAIGACVVAGNVRRSAEIALGDVHDETFMNLKNYEKHPERQDIGWMSNNSVVLTAENSCDSFRFLPDLAQRIGDNGEPGMINLINIQKFGRFGKPMPDKATLVNPCAEISLENFELCNLAEVFPTRCADETRFNAALRYATFYASTVSLLPTHRPETNAVIARNRRIGVSISGIAQWVSNANLPAGWPSMDYTRLTTILRNGYKLVRAANAEFAAEAGVPASVRVTTVKPSGTISLLAGTTPGVHFPVSRYVIRRVRIAETSPLVPALRAAGVPDEKDACSSNTLVFSFMADHGPMRACEDVTPQEQFALVALLQRCWADNCVSATVYFDKARDGPHVGNMLALFIPQLKSISMLPHSGHGYAQAPLEPVDAETYARLAAAQRRPEFVERPAESIGSKYCEGDKCERVTQ